VSSLDITAAFGYNPFTRKSPMFFRMEANENRDGKARVYQVMSLIYGLPEASLAFYELLADWMVKEKGWKQGRGDVCMLTRGTLWCLVSTDNVLIANDSSDASCKELAALQAEFQESFDITIDPTLTDGHLGTNIDVQEDSISLTMPTKIEKLKDTVFPGLGDDVYPDHLTVLEPMKGDWAVEAAEATDAADTR
jgi:hypothetical protein